MSDKHQILKGIGKGLGQLGVETVEKVKEEGGKVVESIITAKQLLGLDKTMSDSEFDFRKHEEEQKKAEEIKKLKGEMGQNENKKTEEKQTEKKRDVEGEMEELRRQKEKEEEEKERYFEEEKRKREAEKQQQEAEYDGLMVESSNPAKQKKSRGSAFITKKKKSQPTQSQMSQTSEFKGKID